jgi:hypothetical protein
VTIPPETDPGGAPPGGPGPGVAFFRRNHRRGSMRRHSSGQDDVVFHAARFRREPHRKFRALALSRLIAARVSFEPLTRDGRVLCGVRCGGKMPVSACSTAHPGGI